MSLRLITEIDLAAFGEIVLLSGQMTVTEYQPPIFN